MTGMEQVVRQFTALKLALEAGLAGLELAALYLKEGRTADVKGLAVAMGWIFKAKGITEKHSICSVRPRGRSWLRSSSSRR